jgi:hypothetical protein
VRKATVQEESDRKERGSWKKIDLESPLSVENESEDEEKGVKRKRKKGEGRRKGIGAE